MNNLSEKEKQKKVFQSFKDSIINIDPVAFCEKHLILDGEPFRLLGNGYRPFVDLYRYLGIKSLEKDAKGVVLCKSRQVGATIMAANLKMYFMASGLFGINKPPMRLLHCFPTLVHVHTYCKTKLNPTIANSISVGDEKFSPGKKHVSFIQSKIDKTSQSNDSLQYKQFIGDNFIRIESTGADADRLRGGTADGVLFDECQDIPKNAIQNTLKLLIQSKYGPTGEGVVCYFGTPKMKGSFYWDLWNNSTQQYFHLGCEKCEETFPLYTAGSDLWEKIWLTGYIVKCPHCGHEQDKRQAAERGRWITDRDIKDYKYVGFHINTLYMPIFTKEHILAMKPENNPEMGEVTYQNEVLGEFYAGDASPITADEIRSKCGDAGRKMIDGALPSNGINYFLGLDWGLRTQNSGDKGQSYSTAVVLAEEAGKLSIVFATLLKKNDFEYKQQIVEKIMRQYSIKYAVGDIGYANDLTEVLSNKFANFYSSRAMGKLNTKIRAIDVGESGNKEIQFDRTYHLEEMFDLLKRGLIRFPMGSYEQIAWLITHCSSMELKVTKDSVNDPVVRYVKGSTPNDGLMSLLNAYLAVKYHRSGGFNGGSGNLLTSSNKDDGKILAISADISW